MIYGVFSFIIVWFSIDINECLDEDMYNCSDELHKCVNTRGSYKCECEQGLYFINGTCRGINDFIEEVLF